MIGPKTDWNHFLEMNGAISKTIHVYVQVSSRLSRYLKLKYILEKNLTVVRRGLY